MKYGRVLRLEFYSKALQFVVKNKLLIILSVFFISGFCAAIFCFSDSDIVTEFIKEYLSDFINERNGGKIFKTIIGSFLSYLCVFALSFICGTSMFGMILIPALITLCAYFYGSLTAYVYSAYSFEGVAFFAVIILLPSVLFITAFLLASIEGINFSFKLSKLTFLENSASDLMPEFKNYCMKYLLFSVLVFISSVADCLLSHNFLKNFSGII